jgi:hypothetical protein
MTTTTKARKKKPSTPRQPAPVLSKADQELEAMRAAGARILRSPAKRRAALIDIGYYDKNGQVTEFYRD